MTHIHRIADRATLDRLAAVAASVTPHHLPLFRAVRAGLIEFVIPRRETGWRFLREADAKRRPVLVLIGDDDHASTGPDGWRCARRLAPWTRAAVVHGTGGEAAHYAVAVGFAIGHGRLVMVETDSTHLSTWTALFANRVPVLTIRPPDAGPHPASVPPERMQ